MSEIVRLATPAEVAREAARRWAEIAQAAVSERGRFSVVLAGGKAPVELYKLLASEPWRSQAPWEHTAVFWGDERRVPASHPDSNYRMARELLLDFVPIPQSQIFRMPSEGLAGGDIREYEERIRRYFDLGPREWPRFDLFLLGMGADGHIASIFPGTRAVSDRTNMVVVYEVPQLRAERMTLTLPVINHARHVLFLVTGLDKARVVKAVLEGPQRVSTYPAQAVQPVEGAVVWLLDQAAASELVE